jgi:hypothetical protein
MRIFKNGWFRRYAEREDISDAALIEAVVRAREGLIDANLGGGLIKQRIARPGQGRSGGFRSVIVYRQGEVAFFVFGFAKNSVDNLNVVELREFRKMASHLLALDDSQIDALMRCGQMEEVKL